MTELEVFNYNKKIAIDNNLFASEIINGPSGEFLGMVYFLDTECDDPRDQQHFAYALDFVNKKDESELILNKLLKGEFYVHK